MQREFQSNKKKHASGTFHDWKSIKWELVEKKVRSIQERIVKATKAGKHRKVKSLQWLLVNSWYAKLLAIKRVTENKGKNTPGIDRIVWSNPKDKFEAAKSLKNEGYKASPLKRVYIPKSNGKKRPLGIPTMKDRAMQALHLLALNPIAETTADSDSYGFRPERCCADAIEQCFNIFSGHYSAQWVLEADIKGCFDNISHKWLLENIPMDNKILKQWLKAGFIDKKEFFASREGTPQGGIISPVLANLTLDGMENFIYKACGSRVKHKINFVRYADDFIISANDKTILEETILPAVIKFLEKRGLQIQHEKTKISHITTGFDFLGQNVRKYNGKLLIKPSKKSIKAIKHKIFDTIKECNGFSTEMLIFKLNPILRGWANYHRYVVSKEVFRKIDNDTFWALWRWAKRRHDNKLPKWIKKKYFKSIGNQNWVFAANSGKNKTVRLFNLESIPIKRFVKVRKKANPYDPEWYTYFNKRKRSRVR